MEVDALANESVVENTSSNNASIKSKICTGEFQIVEKRGKSKVWEVFGLIVNANGEEIPNFVACRKCGNVYKSANSTSNLIKHKCYTAKTQNTVSIQKENINPEKKKEGVKILTEWIVENGRPFKIVSDSGLQKVAEYFISIGATYGQNVDVSSVLPNPTTISRNIENLYEICFNQLKAELESVKHTGFGLTTDIWVDNYIRKHYIAVTIHYVKNEKLENKLLGMQSMNGERCTSENVRSKVCKLLNEFGIDLNSKAVIVTDRGSNMVAAFRNDNHLFCINHLLHNVLQKAIEDSEEVRELCHLCTQLVKYFKKSGLNTALNTTLKSFSPTRWNTIYYLLVSITANWGDIYLILQEKNELQKICSIQLHHLNEIVRILESFEKASKKLEGENYATIHLTYVYIHRITKICAPDASDANVIKIFKEKLILYLESIVLKNLTEIHKVALFLFPPAKQLLLFSEEDKIVTKNACLRLMENCIEENLDSQEEHLSTFSQEDSELYFEFVQQLETHNSRDQIRREMHVYENTNVLFHTDFKILEWWHLHKNEFPILYKVSCNILATPASSAASERVFSVARNIITEKRCRITHNDDNIKQIMFLHSNTKEI